MVNLDPYLHHLSRATFQTSEDGMYSSSFRIPHGVQIVDVDWSVSGQVTVTYLKSGHSPC